MLPVLRRNRLGRCILGGVLRTQMALIAPDEELKCMVEELWVERAITLIEGGVDVHSRYSLSKSLLMWAAEQNSLVLCSLLLQKGLSLRDVDELGQTPLHYGAPHEDIVEFLLQEGADPLCTDRFGESPLDIALLAPSYKSARRLFAAGATVSDGIWMRLLGEFHPPSMFDLIDSLGPCAPRFTCRPYEFLVKALEESDWDLAIWLLRRAVRDGASSVLEPGTIGRVLEHYEDWMSKEQRIALKMLADLAET